MLFTYLHKSIGLMFVISNNKKICEKIQEENTKLTQLISFTND